MELAEQEESTQVSKQLQKYRMNACRLGCGGESGQTTVCWCGAEHLEDSEQRDSGRERRQAREAVVIWGAEGGHLCLDSKSWSEGRATWCTGVGGCGGELDSRGL